MVNPAEDIVNIWLQECKNHFTISNIVVGKETREIEGRKVGGGRGKEIDLISTDGKNYFWIEVSVSASPRLPSKDVRLKEIINNALNKFADEKRKYLQNRFGKSFEKWFIYSPKMFSKKTDEEKGYCEALEKKGIRAIAFDIVLKDVYGKLNYVGYDVTRNYLYLLKKFQT